MIKVNFGTVEVTGVGAVVMAELLTLLKVLRNELGEERYNRVLQDVNDSKLVEDETGEKKAEFEPYLTLDHCGHYGQIGEETDICDITGKKLSVGDTVNLYSIKSNGQILLSGECSVVKTDDSSSFVMGVCGSKFDHGVSCGDWGNIWLIILNRRHTEVKDGEVVDSIKYIKSERTGK